MDSNTQLLSKPVAPVVPASTAQAHSNTQRTLTIVGVAVAVIGAAAAAYNYYEQHRAAVENKVHTMSHAKTPSTAKKGVTASAATFTTKGLTSSSKSNSRYGSRRGSGNSTGKLYSKEDTPIISGFDVSAVGKA